ncbi:MAG: hypothetical protein ACRCV9_14080 [Burkholderiaceae bacterium]
MRALLILLILANLLFFGLRQGWFGPMLPQTAEPQRLQNQISPTTIKVLTEAEMTSASKTYSAKSAAATVFSAAPQASSCLEWGGFSGPDVQKAATLLAGLDLGSKLTRKTREEKATHMVLMGPFVERPETERKAAEVRRLGVTDVAVIENAQGRFVSLGVFVSQQGAQARLAEVRGKGVTTARVSERETAVTREVFQVRDVDAALDGKLRGLSGQMNGAAWVACGA